MNLVREFFPRAFFVKFWKRAGKTYPPPLPYSYAPEVDAGSPLKINVNFKVQRFSILSSRFMQQHGSTEKCLADNWKFIKAKKKKKCFHYESPADIFVTLFALIMQGHFLHKFFLQKKRLPTTFLDSNIFRENGKIEANVFWQKNFNGVYIRTLKALHLTRLNLLN